ncbi:hypothetical protein ACWIGW_10610 [Nocardia brasiliensis]
MTSSAPGVAAKAVAGLARPVGSWLWRRIRPDISRPALAGYADILAEAIRRRETVLRDQLRSGPGTLMELELLAAERFPSGPALGIGGLSDLCAHYRGRRVPQRLVLVGAPGAGKTVSALHLTLDLLRERTAAADHQRVDVPVPVRVNASGWDGTAALSGWVALRLRSDYGLHLRVARALVDTGRILPVLDGLDEMDAPDAEPKRACAVLDRLNETPWRNRPVVVVCRDDEFAAIARLRGDAGLHGATTIAVQPLTVTDSYCYLHEYREQLGVPERAWAPVTEQLADDPAGPLAVALRTPWLLGLAASALQHGRAGTAAALAACNDVDGVRNLLYTSMIPAAIAGTEGVGARRSYTEQNVHTWLRSLARHLVRERARGRGGTDIALDRIWELAGAKRCRALHGIMAGAVFMTVFAYSVGVTRWSVYSLVTSFVFGAFGVVMFGLARATPKSRMTLRFAWRVPGRSNLLGRLARGLGYGFLFGFVGMVLGYLMSGAGLTAGFAVGTGLGVAMGITTGLGTTGEERLILGQDERRVIRDDLTAAVVGALTAGIAGFLSVLLALWLLIAVATGDYAVGGLWLLITLFYKNLLLPGLLAGAVGGFAIGLSSVRYALAALLFRVFGSFAPRPARFLDWARDAGLLRVTGIAYQFRQDTYQDWLAAPRE